MEGNTRVSLREVAFLSAIWEDLSNDSFRALPYDDLIGLLKIDSISLGLMIFKLCQKGLLERQPAERQGNFDYKKGSIHRVNVGREIYNLDEADDFRRLRANFRLPRPLSLFSRMVLPLGAKGENDQPEPSKMETTLPDSQPNHRQDPPHQREPRAKESGDQNLEGFRRVSRGKCRVLTIFVQLFVKDGGLAVQRSEAYEISTLKGISRGNFNNRVIELIDDRLLVRVGRGLYHVCLDQSIFIPRIGARKVADLVSLPLDVPTTFQNES